MSRLSETTARLHIDPAQPDDVEEIVTLIRELAEYERLADQVRIQPSELREHLFGRHCYAEAVLARVGGQTVGFALFFHNYSTFAGRPGLYLEDLFVRKEHRGQGYGKQLLRHLAGIAADRGCARFEWAVLNWNKPAIDFYRKLGAVPMNDWTVFRLEGEPLAGLGAGRPVK
jgi:GNAT superfamily N-acetyltransferase